MLEVIKKYGILLAIFATIAMVLTALISRFTNNIIEKRATEQQIQLLDQVVTPDLYDNQLLDDCYLVINSALGSDVPHRLYIARKGGTPVAAAIETTAPDGYAGAIYLLVGADFYGNVLGVLATQHHETPGLGDKIELQLSNWITHFRGKSLRSDNYKNWAVKKDGGMFDQFTGATITPRAVVNAVKRTVAYLKDNFNSLEKMPHCGKLSHE